MGGAARRNYLSQRLRIKVSQSLGTPVPIAAKFHFLQSQFASAVREPFRIEYMS